MYTPPNTLPCTAHLATDPRVRNRYNAHIDIDAHLANCTSKWLQRAQNYPHLYQCACQVAKERLLDGAPELCDVQDETYVPEIGVYVLSTCASLVGAVLDVLEATAAQGRTDDIVRTMHECFEVHQDRFALNSYVNSNTLDYSTWLHACYALGEVAE